MPNSTASRPPRTGELPPARPPMYSFAAKLVQPFTFSVLLLGIVLITLRCRRRERQRALTVALVAYAVLMLASMNFVTELVLRPLEDRATPLAEPPHDVSAM